MLRLAVTWWGVLLLTVAVDATAPTTETQLYITAGVLGGLVLLLCCAVAFLMFSFVNIQSKVSKLQKAIDAQTPQQLRPIQGGVENTSHPPASPPVRAAAPYYGQVRATQPSPQQGQHDYQPQQQRPYSAYAEPSHSAAPYGGQRPGQLMSQQPAYRQPGGADPYSYGAPARPHSSYYPDQRARPPYSSDRY